MVAEECPLPEVAIALHPFIKPRDEVASLRQSLHRHLHVESRGGTETPTTFVNLPLIVSTAGVSETRSLSGVRHAYWKALQAHNAAQAKYDVIKADLENVKSETIQGLDTLAVSPDSSQVHEYLPLARQREKRRRLKAIDCALSKINSAAAGESTPTVDEIVKSEIGDLPIPPSSQGPSTGSPNLDADGKILTLKRALVSTKRKVGEQKSLHSLDRIAGQTFTTHAKIIGLQAALQELTTWMESQLATIAEAGSEGHAANGSSAAYGPTSTPVKSRGTPTDDFGDLYEDYLSARERLIDLIQPPAERPSDVDAELLELFKHQKDATDHTTVRTPAEVLLPHLSALAQNKREEQAALQQVAHTRQQIATSEQESDAAIRRLAGESHLVLPESRKAGDWALSANTSRTAVRELVNTQARRGENAAVHAGQVLEDIYKLSQQMD